MVQVGSAPRAHGSRYQQINASGPIILAEGVAMGWRCDGMAEDGTEPGRDRGQSDTAPLSTRLVYEPNPKHKPIPTPGRHGSVCPPEANGPSLLRSSDFFCDQRYATDGSSAYCAQRHDPGNIPGQETWHGYPIDWDEVPPSLVTQWVAEEKVQRRTIRRAKRQRER
jgi:hypothetical protein